MTDPKTILSFLNEHFNDIKTLYRINQKQKTISDAEIEKIFKTKQMIDRLKEYEIIDERESESFVLNQIYQNFISFLLDDFSLDMPEQIKKYSNSLSDLYDKLKAENNKNDVIDTIDNLINEVSIFESQLQRNINKLIKDSKFIKINKEKLDYSQKMEKTKKLTATYVTPLNVILNEHDESIFSIIKRIIGEANNHRFSHVDTNLQNKYQVLYGYYSNISDKLLIQNNLLIQEVLPLLDTIKTENEILSGCITFLNNDKEYSMPSLLHKRKNTTYSNNAKYDAQNIWEGYQDIDEEIIIDKSEPIQDKWFYNKNKYRSILMESLPIDNFYQFIGKELEKTLEKDLQNIESKKFFDLSKLIFEKDIALSYKNHRLDIELSDVTLSVPSIKIRGIN